MGITRHPLVPDDPSGRLKAVPLDQALIGRLETSFARAAADGDRLTRRFYEKLFTAQPALRKLFPTDLEPQRKKLYDMLQSVIATLRDPAAVRSQLMELGARHVGYGALPVHYPIVVQMLVSALAECSGSDWSEDLQRDWNEAIQLVSEQMLAGAGRISR